ncbi:MAG: hypothetical protein FWD50_00405 [Betaproteobacteria bacterium]|nr:hypothetical protein [Betaproteobacteria bacterium]
MKTIDLVDLRRLQQEIWLGTGTLQNQLALIARRTGCEERMAVLNCMVVGGENWLQRQAKLLMRTARVSAFKKLKKEFEELEQQQERAFARAAEVLEAYGKPVPIFSSLLWKARADEDTSLDNEKWCDNMDAALDRLEDCFDDTMRQTKKYGEVLKEIETQIVGADTQRDEPTQSAATTEIEKQIEGADTVAGEVTDDDSRRVEVDADAELAVQ